MFRVGFISSVLIGLGRIVDRIKFKHPAYVEFVNNKLQSWLKKKDTDIQRESGTCSLLTLLWHLLI